MPKKLALGIIVLLVGCTLVSAVEKFKDMPDDHWAARSVYNVVRLGVTRGYPDGTFRGEKSINRYELMVFLSNLAIAMERMMDEKMGNASQSEDATGNRLSAPRSAINERVLEELRAEIETLKAAILKGEGRVLNGKEPKTSDEQLQWNINGSFEFTHRTIQANQATSGTVLPRVALQLQGDFKKSGFLVDIDTNYIDVKNNTMFNAITNNILALKGWTHAALSDSMGLTVEASVGPGQQKLNDFYLVDAVTPRFKLIERPANAFSADLDLAALTMGYTYRLNGTSEENDIFLGVNFDAKKKSYVGIGYQAENATLGKRALVDGKLYMGDNFYVGLNAASDQLTTTNALFYELGLGYQTKATQITIAFNTAQQWFNTYFTRTYRTNALGYEIFRNGNAGSELSLYGKQSLNDVLYVVGGASSFSTAQANAITLTMYDLGIGLGFDSFTSLQLDYTTVSSTISGTASNPFSITTIAFAVTF